MKPLDGTGLKRLHREWRHRTAGRLALVLDNVQSPFNVGAIVRTAAAFRVEHAWLVGATPELDDAKVRKTALGCDRYLTWQRAENAADALAGARTDGFSPVGLELADGASPLHEVAFSGDVCLVIGHEDRGLSASTLDACDAVAYVPMLGKVGSLNVATAAAIALYELRRQRW
jgi:tRNA (guanosine-2'-O-)-methyltransferase